MGSTGGTMHEITTDQSGDISIQIDNYKMSFKAILDDENEIKGPEVWYNPELNTIATVLPLYADSGEYLNLVGLVIDTGGPEDGTLSLLNITVYDRLKEVAVKIGDF